MRKMLSVFSVAFGVLFFSAPAQAQATFNTRVTLTCGHTVATGASVTITTLLSDNGTSPEDLTPAVVLTCDSTPAGKSDKTTITTTTINKPDTWMVSSFKVDDVECFTTLPTQGAIPSRMSCNDVTLTFGHPK